METNTSPTSLPEPVAATTTTTDTDATPGSPETEVESTGESQPATSHVFLEEATAALHYLRTFISNDKQPWTLESNLATVTAELFFVREMMEGLEQGNLCLDGDDDVITVAGLLIEVGDTLQDELEGIIDVILDLSISLLSK